MKLILVATGAVIAAYNAQAHLADTLRSVWAQTLLLDHDDVLEPEMLEVLEDHPEARRGLSFSRMSRR